MLEVLIILELSFLTYKLLIILELSFLTYKLLIDN